MITKTRCRLHIYILVLSLLTIPGFKYSWAQEISPHEDEGYRVVLLMTSRKIGNNHDDNDRDSVILASPYSFEAEYFTDPFAREFFKCFKKNKIKAYRDPELNKSFTYKAFTNEAFFIDYFLTNSFLKGKKPKSADILPDYQVNLCAIEKWYFLNEPIRTEEGNIDNVKRELISMGLILTDFNKPNLPALEIFFPFHEIQKFVNKLKIRRDFSSILNVDPQFVIKNKIYNFKLLDSDKPLPTNYISWEASINHQLYANRYLGFYDPDSVSQSFPILRNDLGKKTPCYVKNDYRILIPLTPTAENTPNFILVDQPDYRNWQQNRNLFTQVLPGLIRDILKNKIPSYSELTQYDLDGKEEKKYRRLKLKPNDILSEILKYSEKNDTISDGISNSQPFNKKSLDKLDYSHNVIELELSGKLLLKAGKITFLPENIGIICGKQPEDPTKSVIARIKFKDLKKLNYLTVNNVPLQKFLSELDYAYYLYRVGSCYPDNILDSFYLDCLLWSGKWKELNNQNELKFISDKKKIDYLKSAKRAK